MTLGEPIRFFSIIDRALWPGRGEAIAPQQVSSAPARLKQGRRGRAAIRAPCVFRSAF
jgi:hypothetical protein